MSRIKRLFHKLKNLFQNLFSSELIIWIHWTDKKKLQKVYSRLSEEKKKEELI